MSRQIQDSKAQTAKDYEMKTSNRFQNLSDFPALPYSIVAQNPSAKLQNTPTIQSSISNIGQSIPSSQSSSFQSPYITKNFSESLILTSFTETPDYKTLLSFLLKVFPKDCQWMADDHHKTQRFYEFVLIDSGSIDVHHTYDKKIPSKIAYSKCIIKKVLKPSEWMDLWTIKEFSVNFNPRGYTYHDYRMAWMRAFLLRPFDHSWFFTFHTHSSEEFPIWFYEWWHLFGSIPEVLPTIVQTGFNTWISKTKGPYYQQSLLFYKEFKVPWIFCWSYKIAQKYDSKNQQYPMSLVREFKIKWWDKFEQHVCSPAAVTDFIQTGKKIQYQIQQVSKEIQKKEKITTASSSKASSKIQISSDSDEEIDLQAFLQFQKFKKLQKQLKAAKSSRASSEGSSSCDPMGGPCAQDPFEL